MGLIDLLRRLRAGEGSASRPSAPISGGSKMNDSQESPFQIALADSMGGGAQVREEDPSVPGLERIDRLVKGSDLFVFIKGTPQQPMCGFSANTVMIMDTLGLSYSTFDVLSDQEIREGAKEYANWPTFPQLYVHGEFVGGNDIITEMAYSGELQQLVQGVSR
jgi:monothiol glutaredoxin